MIRLMPRRRRLLAPALLRAPVLHPALFRVATG
jgi:hypothetical protein